MYEWAKTITLAEINKTTEDRRVPWGSIINVKVIGEEGETIIQSAIMVLEEESSESDVINIVIDKKYKKKAEKRGYERENIVENKTLYLWNHSSVFFLNYFNI